MIRPEVLQSGMLTGHKDAIYTLLAGNSHNSFYSAGGDGLIVSWQLDKDSNGEAIARLDTAIYSLAVYNGLLLAGTRFGKLYVFDLAAKQVLHTLSLEGDIFDLKVIQEEQLCIAACAGGHLYYISLADYSILHHLNPTNENAREIAVNDKLKHIATGWSDNYIRIYNYEGKLIDAFEAHGKSIFALAYSPLQPELLSGGRDAQLKVWSAAPGHELKETIPAHLFTINDIVYSPDSKYFLTASRDKTIKLWNAENAELLKVIDRSKFNAHTHSVNKVFWLDEQTFISGGDDKRVLVWKIVF